MKVAAEVSGMSELCRLLKGRLRDLLSLSISVSARKLRDQAAPKAYRAPNGNGTSGSMIFGNAAMEGVKMARFPSDFRA